MGWIEEARERGKEEAARLRLKHEQEAILKSQFDSEPLVTEDLAKEFLLPFQTPVLEVIDGLEKRGFTTEQFGPDYLHYEFGRVIKQIKHLNMLSLIKYEEETVSSTLNGSTIDLPRDFRAYGVEWKINSGQKLLGLVTIFPIISESSPLGGARYRLSKGQAETVKDTDYTSPVNHVEAVEKLQKAVGFWIEAQQGI